MNQFNNALAVDNHQFTIRGNVPYDSGKMLTGVITAATPATQEYEMLHPHSAKLQQLIIQRTAGTADFTVEIYEKLNLDVMYRIYTSATLSGALPNIINLANLLYTNSDGGGISSKKNKLYLKIVPAAGVDNEYAVRMKSLRVAY